MSFLLRLRRRFTSWQNAFEQLLWDAHPEETAELVRGAALSQTRVQVSRAFQEDLVKRMLDSKQIPEALELLRSFSEHRDMFPVSKKGFNLCIEKLCRLGMLQAAQQVLEELATHGLTVDAHSYGHLIRGFLGQGDEARALELFESMMLNGIDPLPETISVLVQHQLSLGSPGRIAIVSDVFERRNRHLKLGMILLEVRDLCVQGRIDEVFELFQDKQIRFDSHEASALLRRLLEIKETEVCTEVFERFNQLETVEYGGDFYQFGLIALLQQRSLHSAFNLLNFILKNKFVLHNVVLKKLFESCTHPDSNPYSSRSIVLTLVENRIALPDRMFLKLVSNSMEQKQFFETASFIKNVNKHAKYELPKGTLKYLLHNLVLLNATNKLKELVEVAFSWKNESMTQIYRALVESLAQKVFNDPQDLQAASLMTQLVQECSEFRDADLPISLFHSALKALSKCSADRTQQVFDCMQQKQNLAPDCLCFTYLARAYARESRFEETLENLKAAAALGTRPLNGLFHSIVEAEGGELVIFRALRLVPEEKRNTLLKASLVLLIQVGLQMKFGQVLNSSLEERILLDRGELEDLSSRTQDPILLKLIERYSLECQKLSL